VAPPRATVVLRRCLTACLLIGCSHDAADQARRDQRQGVLLREQGENGGGRGGGKVSRARRVQGQPVRHVGRQRQVAHQRRLRVHPEPALPSAQDVAHGGDQAVRGLRQAAALQRPQGDQARGLRALHLRRGQLQRIHGQLMVGERGVIIIA
jgi:hypothetical protein